MENEYILDDHEFKCEVCEDIYDVEDIGYCDKCDITVCYFCSVEKLCCEKK